MGEDAVQARVWLAFDADDEEQNLVAELLRDHDLPIANTWSPESTHLEYQTEPFADSEANQNTIQELKSTLASEFPSRGISLDFDTGSHHIRDKPYDGIYNLKIE